MQDEPPAAQVLPGAYLEVLSAASGVLLGQPACTPWKGRRPSDYALYALLQLQDNGPYEVHVRYKRGLQWAV